MERKEPIMMKNVLPVAVTALVLSVGGALAEPPTRVTEGATVSIGNHQPGQITHSEMLSVTGKGATCTNDFQRLGRAHIFLGLIGRSHQMIAIGQVMIGLAPFVCAL